MLVVVSSFFFKFRGIHNQRWSWVIPGPIDISVCRSLVARSHARSLVLFLNAALSAFVLRKEAP